MHERRHGACRKVSGRFELTLENSVEWDSIDLLSCFGEYSYPCFLGTAERLQSDVCRMSGRGRQQHPCSWAPLVGAQPSPTHRLPLPRRRKSALAGAARTVARSVRESKSI